MPTHPTEVALFGSGRLDLLSRPLEENFQVTHQQDLTADKKNKLSKIKSIRDYLESSNAPVILDSLGLNLLIIAKMATRYGNTVYLRPRGGFWGEFEDRHQPNTVYQATQIAKTRQIRDRVVHQADYIIPVSHFHKAQIKHTYPKLDTPMSVVYTPYNEESVSSSTPDIALKEKWGIEKQGPLLLSVTEFDYRSKASGIVDFASAINSVLTANDSAYYVVAGDGQYKEQIEQRFRDQLDKDVQQRVLFPGFISQIATVYDTADIFLHLSFRDTLAKTVIEAQRSGLPVVVNTGGGMPEVVNPNGDANGIVRTNSDLETHLTGIIANQPLCNETGQANKEWAQTNYHSSSIAGDFEDVLLYT